MGKSIEYNECTLVNEKCEYKITQLIPAKCVQSRYPVSIPNEDGILESGWKIKDVLSSCFLTELPPPMKNTGVPPLTDHELLRTRFYYPETH